MASVLPPKKNSAYIFNTPLISRTTGQFQANPTLAAGDVKVSTDGGAFANLATLPVVTPAGGDSVKVSLSAGEMNGDHVVVEFKDAAGAEWNDRMFDIHTSAQTLDEVDVNVDTLVSRLTATRATYLDYLFSIYFGLVTAVAQAQAGSTSTIKLANTSSAVTDYYKGQTVVIYTGTGAGQARAINAYNGGSFVATVTPNWATAPDGTSWYVIINVGSAVVGDWTGAADAVWDELLTGHQTVNTAGEVLQVMQGNWTIVDNQLLCYDLSGNLKRTFNLTRDGTASEFNPDKREIV
jgi:hypothetical protein